MPLFGGRKTTTKPAARSCPICGDELTANVDLHMMKHCVAVTDENRQQGAAWRCTCGISPGVYGAGEDPFKAKERASMALRMHLQERHNFPLQAP